MFTRKALANRLLALSNRFYKMSVLSLALCNKTHYFSQNKFYYRISVLEQPVVVRFQAIIIVSTLFYKLVFSVKIEGSTTLNFDRRDSGISESWLDSEIPELILVIPAYQIRNYTSRDS